METNAIYSPNKNGCSNLHLDLPDALRFQRSFEKKERQEVTKDLPY